MTTNDIIKADSRALNVFNKKLKDWHLERQLSAPEMNAIMRAIQKAYDLGYADGHSEAWYEFNDHKEENKI